MSEGPTFKGFAPRHVVSLYREGLVLRDGLLLSHQHLWSSYQDQVILHFCLD